MTNGLQINVSETEFKSKHPAERDWMLYQGIEEANRRTAELNKHGCDYGREKHRPRRTLVMDIGKGLMYAIAGGVAAGIAVYEKLCGKGVP